jgi:hypothetical protein
MAFTCAEQLFVWLRMIVGASNQGGPDRIGEREVSQQLAAVIEAIDLREALLYTSRGERQINRSRLKA